MSRILDNASDIQSKLVPAIAQKNIPPACDDLIREIHDWRRNATASRLEVATKIQIVQLTDSSHTHCETVAVYCISAQSAEALNASLEDLRRTFEGSGAVVCGEV